MVNIDKVPRTIGADFTVWHPDSKITLTNVPFDNNYRDAVKFESQAKFNEWIDARKARNVDIDGSRFYRINEPIRIQIPFTEAYNYNYVRVLNPGQPNVGVAPMYTYYFIIGIDSVTPTVTSLTVQPDFWQTFADKVEFGQVFIERGHIGIAHDKANDNQGRDYLTLAEGLDSGSDLKIVEERQGRVLFEPVHCSFMVVTTTDFTAEPGTTAKPNLKTSKGTRINRMPSGASVWFFRQEEDFRLFISQYSPYPWVLQGIQSITAIPDLETLGYKFKPVKLPNYAQGAYTLDENADDFPRGVYSDIWPNWRKEVMTKYVPARYRNLTKFLTTPYAAVEITYYNGAPIILKPELWASDNAPIAEKLNIMAPGSRLVSYPRRYNGISDKPVQYHNQSDGSKELYSDSGEYLSVSTMVSNFPTFAIVANSGVLALANQAHSLAQQYKSADWSQTKALRSNEVSYDQATAGNNNMQANAQIGRNAAISTNNIANEQNVARTVVSAGTGLANGAMGGPQALASAAVGAAASAAGTALDINQRNSNLAISNQAGVDSTRNNANTANYMRDTNRGLSDYAARGDYEQSIASINAKVQDTAMSAPFTAAQAGGDSFVFAQDLYGIKLRLRWKLIPPAEMRAVGEYWLRYGYAVRQFSRIPKSLQVMTKFTYWKLSETYLISTEVPEFIKQMIRGMFEKGITMWASPDYIGTTDPADNQPLKNIKLGN